MTKPPRARARKTARLRAIGLVGGPIVMALEKAGFSVVDRAEYDGKMARLAEMEADRDELARAVTDLEQSVALLREEQDARRSPLRLV